MGAFAAIELTAVAALGLEPCNAGSSSGGSSCGDGPAYCAKQLLRRPRSQLQL